MRRRRAGVVPFAAAAAIAVVLTACGAGGGRSSDDVTAGQSSAPASTTKVATNFHPVAGNFKPNDAKLEDCGRDGANACYEQAFGNIAYYQGPKAALKVFDESIAKPGPIESDCHRIVHTIGSASLARFKGNVAKAFSEGSSSCWSGYYHGILERAFVAVNSTSVADVGSVARGLCDDTEVRRITWILYQCVHGLGHGLMINSGYNLPFSLDVCDELATAWDQTSCKGGVFMENISSSYGFASPWLKEDDPVYPCNSLEENDKPYCYLMVTSRILRWNNWDWEGTAKVCAGVEKGWVATCFQSYGRDASGSTRQNPEEILQLCAEAKPFGGQVDCVEAAAKDMTANYTSGLQASALCDKAPAKLRGGCFYAIGSIMGSFRATAEEREADCRAITRNEAYVEQCLRASNPTTTS